MTPTANNRRRQLMVNPAVQSSIIVNISWPPAVALAVSALLLGLFSTKLLDEALVARIELPSLVPMLVTVIGFLVVALGFLIFHALKLSHRIVGPMYRLQKTLAAAKAGDLTVRATLRENDYLVEVAGSLNEFLDVVEHEYGDEIRHQTTTRAGIDDAPAPGPQGLGQSAEESRPGPAPTTVDPSAE